jgi:transcriptional regulator with XRE-family HTH domain
MRAKTPSLSVRREIQKLGQDLSIARRRRKLTQKAVAERAGLDVGTVQRLERGHPSVSLGSLGMVLLVLGERGRLSQLLDVAADDVGLSLSIEALPRRVRTPGRNPSGGTEGTDF